MTKKDVKLVTGAIIIIMIAIVVSLVYAAFTGQLNISNGSGVSRISKWDVHFENLSSITTTHSVKVLTQPRLASGASIEDYSVSLTSPGDTISFTVDVVNDGNYNASITSVSVSTPECTGTDSTSNSNVCTHLHYSLTYDTGATVQVGDTLYAKETNKMKVTLNYDDTVTASELPTEEVSISNLSITINFEQSSDALVKDNGEVADYKVYKQGYKFTLNNEDYYVIEDSGADKDYVVALKDKPLTVAEVNLYGGVGTENNHVNKYSSGLVGTAFNTNGYGGIAYYSSETCGIVNGSNITSGCTTDYNDSDIKYIVDSWSISKFQDNELKIVDGYSARLITKSEYEGISTSYNWRYSSNYRYWTMSPDNNYQQSVALSIYFSGVLYGASGGHSIYNNIGSDTVRPVINVYKSALETNNSN